MCDEDEAVESWSEYNGPPLPLPDLSNHWSSWYEPDPDAPRREPCCFTKEMSDKVFGEDAMSDEEYKCRILLAGLRP